MKYLIFALSLFISVPLTAQNWAAIGNFNRSLSTLYEDTISDELFIGGYFTYFNYDTLVGIAKWSGTSMTTLGCGVEWDCYTTGLSGYSPPVNGIIRYNGDIYITGSFNYAGTKLVNGLARWDGNNWNNIGRGLKSKDGSNGIGLGLKVINNELYIFGIFDSAAGINVNSIVKFDGSNWSEVYNFPLLSGNPQNPNFIFDVDFYNNELYLCGNFYNTSVSIYNIAKWDGSGWVSVGDGIRGSIVDVRKMLVYKNNLIVAGRFSKTVYPGNPGENIAKWNGTQWSELGCGTDDIIWDMKLHNDTLYACGAFRHAGGIDAYEIARWDGTKWCGFGTVFNNVLSTLGFYHDTLYVGGGFSTIDGDSIRTIAKWTGGNYVDTCGNSASINETSKPEYSISISPNPSSGNYTLQFSDLSNGIDEIKIFNILGEAVYSEKVKTIAGSNKASINISGLPDGMYFLRAVIGEKGYGVKIVKQ